MATASVGPQPGTWVPRAKAKTASRAGGLGFVGCIIPRVRNRESRFVHWLSIAALPFGGVRWGSRFRLLAAEGRGRTELFGAVRGCSESLAAS